MTLQFTNALLPLNVNDIEFIVIHHIAKDIAEPEEIHKWHLANGWVGFGYNEYIRKNGTVVIGRGDNIGAHCQGYNSVAYGIAVEGNYDVETVMPQAQYLSLLKRVKYHQKRFKSATIIPHRKLFPTQCPGYNFPWDKLMIGLTMPMLSVGSRGESVTFLQNQVKKAGFDPGIVDGIFGPLTQKAVMLFQQKNKLDPDGICGPLTWNQILVV